MAFKKMESFEEQRFGYFLRLATDEESVNAVFLYKSYEDVLMADVHYINTRSYTGYVHCCESGCPACQKGIRIQKKLFVPILLFANLNKSYTNEDTVLFWDRSINFNRQLKDDVFRKYECPEDFIFRITRHGAYRDIHTTYSIMAKMNCNSDAIQDKLDSMGVKFPDYYEHVVKTVSASDMYDMLNDSVQRDQGNYIPSEDFTYEVKPRKRYAEPSAIEESDAPGVGDAAGSGNGLDTFDPNADAQIDDDGGADLPDAEFTDGALTGVDDDAGPIDDDVDF